MIGTMKTKKTNFSMSSQPDFGKYDTLTLIRNTSATSIPLSIIAILCIDPDIRMSSEIHHFYIELLLAAILSFYYMACATTLNDKFSRVVCFHFHLLSHHTKPVTNLRNGINN